MTDKSDTDGDRPRKAYEPPQAVRLTDADVAYGSCTPGNSFTNDCYRGNHVMVGNCITGKHPTGQCVQGISA